MTKREETRPAKCTALMWGSAGAAPVASAVVLRKSRPVDLWNIIIASNSLQLQGCVKRSSRLRIFQVRLLACRPDNSGRSSRGICRFSVEISFAQHFPRLDLDQGGMKSVHNQTYLPKVARVKLNMVPELSPTGEIYHGFGEAKRVTALAKSRSSV